MRKLNDSEAHLQSANKALDRSLLAAEASDGKQAFNLSLSHSNLLSQSLSDLRSSTPNKTTGTAAAAKARARNAASPTDSDDIKVGIIKRNARLVLSIEIKRSGNLQLPWLTVKPGAGVRNCFLLEITSYFMF